ncbi:MAG: Crp/Fnr family transcriptional regulator [Saprospiraceae bacterium]|jgi:CRP-like cAMP-binding protein|nr:Crp/Fnr family transcriptional regulator [Candidatus Defluviibacterium haderslevense]MBK7244931.1 Crp/Fnr family transcriptional regulator [Candidatus Defluviibacterium haderslevense]MBK8242165.1 Crp/Fnr family transcriptional regulator [Candidatus Defluviibacterium haderslevense]MBL0238231.1 Crp/Fnr family transcriptional regulator [Candidatus Defluviibacterium haderslevense]MCI1266141.1 Crp/Fnr family transcriptional regulator [Saprospiraceae bacterium]
MQIDENILITWGAVVKKYNKNEIIFDEGALAQFYFQIKKGTVKMSNSNDDCKEFTQGVFHDGDSFGEPPLFIDESYPATAVTITDCTIIKLSKTTFFRILSEYPAIHHTFTTLFARRVLMKSKLLRDIINHTPEERIISFLYAFKAKSNAKEDKIHIPYTRQEIANFTGLRVETVIRTLKKLEETRRVDIKQRKLYF